MAVWWVVIPVATRRVVYINLAVAISIGIRVTFVNNTVPIFITPKPINIAVIRDFKGAVFG